MVCNLGKGEGRESHVICFVGIIHNEICYRIAETFEVGRLLQYENIWLFRSKPSTDEYNEITVCVFFMHRFNDLGIPMMHTAVEYANIICSIRLL